jgi:hypothetical protein
MNDLYFGGQEEGWYDKMAYFLSSKRKRNDLFFLHIISNKQ